MGAFRSRTKTPSGRPGAAEADIAPALGRFLERVWGRNSNVHVTLFAGCGPTAPKVAEAGRRGEDKTPLYLPVYWGREQVGHLWVVGVDSTPEDARDADTTDRGGGYQRKQRQFRRDLRRDLQMFAELAVFGEYLYAAKHAAPAAGSAA